MNIQKHIVSMLAAVTLSGWCIVSGCGTSKQAVSPWRAFVTEPVPEIQIDSLVHFNLSKTCTVIPYSSLANDAVVSSRNENWAMFALANGMIERGYRYVDDIASADLVLVERISDDYDPQMDMREELEHAPPFKAVTPFSLISSPFGNDAQLPTATNSSPRSHPVLTIFIYTKEGKLLYRWAEGGLSNDYNFIHASQHLRLRFIDRFPASKFQSQNLPLDTGRLGMELRLWSHDGVNFWPDVGRVLPNTPASNAGIQFGDELLEINGYSMKNVDYRELFRRLRGDVGDTMTIKFFRWTGVKTIQMVMKANTKMR